MPKEITNPVSLIVTAEFDGGVHLASSRVDYGVACTEYPDIKRISRSCDLTYTPAQETAILNFLKDVVKPQIDEYENIV